jgi:hypothetical protein
VPDELAVKGLFLGLEPLVEVPAGPKKAAVIKHPHAISKRYQTEIAFSWQPSGHRGRDKR